MTASIREVLVIPNGSTSQQIVTTGAGTQSGDTLVVIQSTDNNAVTAASAANATLTQVGTDAADGNSAGVLRLLAGNTTSGGAGNITFPNAGGADLYGVVLVMTGSVTVEGFVKSAVGSSATSHTTPATTGLSGAADLLVSIGQNNQGTTWDLTGSGLTSRGQVTTAFGALYVATTALAATGVSPTYTVATVAGAKPAFITVGLDDGAAPPAAHARTWTVAPSLAAVQRASW